MEMFMTDTITDCSIFMPGRIKVGDFTQFFGETVTKAMNLSHRSRIFAHVLMYSCHLEIHVWNLQIRKILGGISSIV